MVQGWCAHHGHGGSWTACNCRARRWFDDSANGDDRLGRVYVRGEERRERRAKCASIFEHPMWVSANTFLIYHRFSAKHNDSFHIMIIQTRPKWCMHRRKSICRMVDQLCWTVIFDRIHHWRIYDGKKMDSYSIRTMFRWVKSVTFARTLNGWAFFLVNAV